MVKNILSVREAEEKDIALIADYWFTADEAYLRGMGADTAKMPTKEDFSAALAAQLVLPYAEKKAYALIWEADGRAIGHSNLNPAVYGSHGYMHLHIWHAADRKKGFGEALIQLSLPFYFNRMQLEKICCEPYALNPAPHRILEKSGFSFVKEYITTPGAITFEQPVKLWELSKEAFMKSNTPK